MWKHSAHHGQQDSLGAGSLGLYINGKLIRLSTARQPESRCVCFSLLLTVAVRWRAVWIQFLLWLPMMIDCDLEMKAKRNPFPLCCFLSGYFITVNCCRKKLENITWEIPVIFRQDSAFISNPLQLPSVTKQSLNQAHWNVIFLLRHSYSSAWKFSETVTQDLRNRQGYPQEQSQDLYPVHSQKFPCTCFM